VFSWKRSPQYQRQPSQVATAVIGAAIEVHRQLGPGFIEKIYQEALCLELDSRGFTFERERAVVVHYQGYSDTTGLRLGLLLNFNGRTVKEGVKRVAV
jgi:hypothetical protein